MTRRREPYTARAQCQEPGCREVAIFEYDRRDEYRRIAETVQRWRCVRHTHADQVLSLANPRREMTLTVGTLEGTKDALLDVDRLRQWADKIETHGPDLMHWASPSFIVVRLREIADRIDQTVREVGQLRAALEAVESRAHNLQEQVEAERRRPSDAYMIACLEGDREALKRALAEARVSSEGREREEQR